MSYRHIYEPTALAEYKEAISWYLERSEIAADNFVKVIKEKIVTICDNPLRYRNAYKKLREVSLKKYPYSIVYFVDEVKQLIIISGVYHHKRDLPQKI
jgi:plasmid stabilization system protein ParE